MVTHNVIRSSHTVAIHDEVLKEELADYRHQRGKTDETTLVIFALRRRQPSAFLPRPQPLTFVSPLKFRYLESHY